MIDSRPPPKDRSRTTRSSAIAKRRRSPLSAPLDPCPPLCKQAPSTSPLSAASRKPLAPVAPAAKPVRQSRGWNAGGPAGLAALEARDAAERQAQLRHAPPGSDRRTTSSGLGHLRGRDPSPPPGPGATSSGLGQSRGRDPSPSRMTNQQPARFIKPRPRERA